MATLIRQGSALLRVGGSLAGSLECCCVEDLPYAICGRRCPWRITNGPIDSEMGACEGDDPEGWDQIYKFGCDSLINLPYDAPFITVFRESCESSPEEFQPREGYGPFCFEQLYAGVPQRYPPNFVAAPFGATRSLTAEGYTQLPDENGGGPYVNKQFFYHWDVWIVCISDIRAFSDTGNVELCELCNGKTNQPIAGYYIGAYLDWSVYEQRRTEDNQIQNGYIRFSATLADGDYGESFYIQQCSDKTDFVQKPQYDPPDSETPREGCVAVPDFYINGNLDIEISTEDGVKIGDKTFPWTTTVSENYADSLGEDFGWNITPEVPDELQNHDGITFYLSNRCCTEDYCNPLP